MSVIKAKRVTIETLLRELYVGKGRPSFMDGGWVGGWGRGVGWGEFVATNCFSLVLPMVKNLCGTLYNMVLLTGCKIQKMTDYRGNDIKKKKKKNKMECAKFCAETKGCLFWTYQPKTKGCWVKKAKKKIKMMGVVSGNRECGL